MTDSKKLALIFHLILDFFGITYYFYTFYDMQCSVSNV